MSRKKYKVCNIVDLTISINANCWSLKHNNDYNNTKILSQKVRLSEYFEMFKE